MSLLLTLLVLFPLPLPFLCPFTSPDHTLLQLLPTPTTIRTEPKLMPNVPLASELASYSQPRRCAMSIRAYLCGGAASHPDPTPLLSQQAAPLPCHLPWATPAVLPTAKTTVPLPRHPPTISANPSHAHTLTQDAMASPPRLCPRQRVSVRPSAETFSSVLTPAVATPRCVVFQHSWLSCLCTSVSLTSLLPSSCKLPRAQPQPHSPLWLLFTPMCIKTPSEQSP